VWHFFQAFIAFIVWSALYSTGAFPPLSYAPSILAGCAAFGATAGLAWLIDWNRARRSSARR
jgi:hypothetical protein